MNASKTGFIRFSIRNKNGSKVTDDILDRFEDHLTVRLKKNDVISRYGGDIFVLCTNCNEEDCSDIAKRMIDAWNASEENADFTVSSEVETVV